MFAGQKEMKLELPATVQSIQDLMVHLRDNQVQDHPELFMQGNTM